MTGLEIGLPDGRCVVLVGYGYDLGSIGYMFLMRGESVEALERLEDRIDAEHIITGKREVLQEGLNFPDEALASLVARMEGDAAFLKARQGALFALQLERDRWLDSSRRKASDALRF